MIHAGSRRDGRELAPGCGDLIPPAPSVSFNAVDLTYRTGLRELNELNFARFDAKLEQRMAELRAELVRWMFGFWVSTLIGIAGLLIALRST